MLLKRGGQKASRHHEVALHEARRTHGDHPHTLGHLPGDPPALTALPDVRRHHGHQVRARLHLLGPGIASGAVRASKAVIVYLTMASTWITVVTVHLVVAVHTWITVVIWARHPIRGASTAWPRWRAKRRPWRGHAPPTSGCARSRRPRHPRSFCLGVAGV